ncbi:MAG: type II toxin-antitoxin system PemK/MazF family toxin [Candidatus Parcubacteria bacterium]|nr:type II toxin-antitoxin system PemK/MazF family toxin [Candidatus Parcubacteria bacterium]
MEKDFDGWNKTKKQIETLPVSKFVHPRDIWWCMLGINIGAESDGKNENFERLVIVMRVYNKETMVVLPMTTKEKKDAFHFEIKTNDKTVAVKLTQTRVISGKRFLRKLDVVDEIQFEALTTEWKKWL